MIDLSGRTDIKLYTPLDIDFGDIPMPLSDLLRECNGIMEMMENPETNEQIEVGWLIYPYDEIKKWTEFFRNTYSINGFVFADNGCGDPYYIKSDGKIYFFECCDNKEVFAMNSLDDFITEIL